MQRLWPIFMKMAEVASYPNMNPEQQRIYMDSLNNYRTVMAAKEYDFSQGEQKKALEIATNLKSMGLSVEQIMQATKLRVDVINSL